MSKWDFQCPLTDGDPLKELSDEEAVISAIADELGEWILIQDRMKGYTETLTEEAYRQLALWKQLVFVRKTKADWYEEWINCWENYIKYYETEIQWGGTKEGHDQAHDKIREGRRLQQLVLEDKSCADRKVLNAIKGFKVFLEEHSSAEPHLPQDHSTHLKHSTLSPTGLPSSDTTMPSKPPVEPLSSPKRKAEDLPADQPSTKRQLMKDLPEASHIMESVVDGVPITRGKERSIEEDHLSSSSNKRQRVKRDSQAKLHRTDAASSESASDKSQIENKELPQLKGRQKMDEKSDDKANLNKHPRREPSNSAHEHALGSLSAQEEALSKMKAADSAVARSLAERDAQRGVNEEPHHRFARRLCGTSTQIWKVEKNGCREEIPETKPNIRPARYSPSKSAKSV